MHTVYRLKQVEANAHKIKVSILIRENFIYIFHCKNDVMLSFCFIFQGFVHKNVGKKHFSYFLHKYLKIEKQKNKKQLIFSQNN